MVSNPPLWFALSHSGACSTSRCSSAAAAVPENPHDREVVDGHLLYSKLEQGWQELPPTSKQQKVMIKPLTAKELGRAEPRCTSWEPQEAHVKPELTRVVQAEAALVSPRLSCSWTLQLILQVGQFQAGYFPLGKKAGVKGCCFRGHNGVS